MTDKPRIAPPVDAVPSPRPSSSFWAEVADSARAAGGKWVPVYYPGSDNARHQAVKKIRAGGFVAFREGKWDATKSGDVIYVREAGDSDE